MRIFRYAVFVVLFLLAVLAYAQTQSRPGHVYVLSNVGSFGEGVYKVGMTQRANPLDRVKELGDASVPFPFDVHVMIATDNPRELEHKVHGDLYGHRVNKANNGKEFFRVDLDTIIAAIEKYHDKPFDVTRESQSWEYQKTLELLNNP